LAVRLAGRWYLAPDNGLLTPVLRQDPEKVMVLRPPDELLAKASATFHGRDILAPMAARLAAVGGLEDVGESVAAQSCCFLPEPLLVKGHGYMQSEIIHIDHFGNLTSNIRRDDIPTSVPMAALTVTIDGLAITGISIAYHEKHPGRPLALWNSGNHLEIAVSSGSAAKVLGAGKGATVRISWPEGC